MATTILKQHIWTFTRSTGAAKPTLQAQGLVLRASWNFDDLHFQVWEPEVTDLTKVAPMSIISCNDFFMIREGGPEVYIYQHKPVSKNVTSYVANIDWVATKNPTFQIPKVIYNTYRYGWHCEITTQVVGNTHNGLDSILFTIIKTDDQGYIQEPAPDSAPAITAKQLCASLAVQVADAIIEMSTWEKPMDATGVAGVDGAGIPDTNLWENCKPLSQEEVNQNLDYAQINRVHTIFGPNDISPGNIVVDYNNRFVGFNSLSFAGFVPRNWISIGMLDPEVKAAANLHILHRATLGGMNCKTGQETRDSYSNI